MGDDDKPFACSQLGCGMRFVNEDHLSVHRMKHEMSLTLTPGTRVGGLGGALIVDFSTDQTPTPTKFLRNCEEIGLFSELSSSKNPFEDAFKKAAQDNLGGQTTPDPPHHAHPTLAALEGGTLNTPTPQQSQPEYIPLPGPTSDSGSTLGSSTGVSPAKPEPDAVLDLRMSTTTCVPATVKVTPSDTLSPVDVEHTPPPDSEDDLSIISSSGVVSLKAEEDLAAAGSLTEKYLLAQAGPSGAVLTSSSQAAVLAPVQVQAQVQAQVHAQVQAPIQAPPPMTAAPHVVITSHGHELVTSHSMPQNVVTSPVNAQGGIAITAALRPQYLMQVMLQLPGGQTVPVQIPAALGPGPSQPTMQVLQPHVMPHVQQVKTEPVLSSSQQPVPVQVPTQIPVQAPVPVSVPVPVPVPQPVSPAQVVVTSTAPQPAVVSMVTTPSSMATEVSTTSSTQSTASAITKQRLKAAITQNVQQSVLQNNMRVMTEAVDRVIAAPAQRPQTLLKASPGGGLLLHSQTPALISAAPSVVQTQAADTSTPFACKRTRKSSEEDPDERRRKFLERNRAAAARCRFKRKQWITNLERKADDINSVSSKMQVEINHLRAEVAQLKSLLLAHKDCPIFVQQRDSGQINLETVNVLKKMEVGADGEQINVPTKVTTLSLSHSQCAMSSPGLSAMSPGVSSPEDCSMVSPTVISMYDSDSPHNILVQQS